MCRDLGLTVLTLSRIAQGPLTLGDLPPGQCRELTAGELAGLRRAVGLEAQAAPAPGRRPREAGLEKTEPAGRKRRPAAPGKPKRGG
jgi:23S rRNA pseudouridine2605 synthase